MKRTLLFLKLCLVGFFFIVTNDVHGQTISATYSAGNIPTSHGAYDSNCNGPLTTLSLTLPTGGPWLVTGIDVSYIMPSPGAWASDQRSLIYCQNTSNGETYYATNSTNSSGVDISYNRNLSIANGTFNGGTPLIFEMRAWRTWSNQNGPTGCTTNYNYIKNNTWKIIVNYALAPCVGTLTPGTTVLSPNSGATNSTINGTVTSASSGAGLTYQWQYYNGTNWTNIAGQTSVSLTTTAMSSFGTRQYRRAISCSGSTAYSVPATFTTGYCTPTSSNTNYYISGFSTQGGTTNITNIANGGPNGGYTDYYNSHTVSQNSGGSIDFNETYIGGSHGFRIWVDFNKNGVFESSELLYESLALANVHTGSFTIPTGTPIGDYRMRIRGQWNNNTVDPCNIIMIPPNGWTTFNSLLV